MRVRVKKGKKGFFGGSLRREGDIFTITPRKHSTETDSNGDPVVISIESQFSGVWMEKLDKEPAKVVAPKAPADMLVPELKAALGEAEANIPDDAKKADLVALLETFQASEQ